MKDHLCFVTVLFLLSFMCWFMWEQNQIIKEQNKYIIELEQKSVIKDILIDSMNQKLSSPFNQKII